MVSIDKTDVKTAQGNMRHANPEIMLSKYAQTVTDEMHGVQVRWFASCGLDVGQISWQTTLEGMQFSDLKRVNGERGRIRTCDPCLKRALLYQLSYAPTLAVHHPY